MMCLYCNINMLNYEDENGILKPLQAGGSSKNGIYETWEIRKCPNCKRKAKESYSYEILK